MVTVNNLTRQTTPKLLFEEIANKILGKRYDLSIVFIGATRSQHLNKNFRQKDKPTNVLAFPLSDRQGEIFIDLGTAKKTARKFEQSLTFHLNFLLIHACLHLKGYDHGSTMESEEDRLIKALKLKDKKINESPNSHRSGHRHDLNSSSRLRIQKRK